MSQQDNFGSGFLFGTLFGGVVGGIVGAVVASRVLREPAEEDAFSLADDQEGETGAFSPSEEEMEFARRGLEDKIAQLNSAIDDVRHRLGTPNGQAQSHEDVN
ncbi:hypothetical protein [Halomicronema sp. CCY15110]|uniref:hypothetical protein n=1 Tax=Halomicronema sp. CCY15110 TaxID=2767773 RepID=UPI00194E0392|nr:hypothetical protein [Halomicronema sp. CCY15110]